MSTDLDSEIIDAIVKAKVYGSSANIRHGQYRFVVRKVFSQVVTTDKGNQKMAFVELTVLESRPNPVSEGDRDPKTGQFLDDGNNPNPVNSDCAMKLNFSNNGATAGGNLKAFVLALFNKKEGELSDAELASTWKDLSREVDAVIDGKAKRANPACGFIIDCSTMPKKKRTPNEKGAYVTKLIWKCADPPGSGLNTQELVQKRRTEILSRQPGGEDDDEGIETTTAPAAPSAPAAPAAAPSAPQSAPQAAPPTPPIPPAPPAPPAAFQIPAGWQKHPTAAWGETPDKQWLWNGTNAPDSVKSVASFMQQ